MEVFPQGIVNFTPKVFRTQPASAPVDTTHGERSTCGSECEAVAA